MKTAKNSKLATEVTLSDSLAEAFNDVANVVNEGALELQKIDDDIKALQAKLKSLNFLGMVKESSIEISDNESLVYDYLKKDFYYKQNGGDFKKLLSLDIKTKKQIHEYYLPELLEKISSDYKTHRATMG